MPTTIEKTIGTGGDYATLALWFAACPADLVAVDQIWKGMVLNQELVSSTTLAITGKTVDATRYIELTAAPGASFMDHADKATNPLRYDATKGAALRQTAASNGVLNITCKYTRVSKLQISNSANSTTAASAIYESGAAGFTDIDQCIIESFSENTSLKGTLRLLNAGSKVRNSVVVQKANVATCVIAYLVSGASAYNCTFVNLGTTPLNFGIGTQYVVGIMKNCYVGGVVLPEDGTVPLNKTTCFSSVAATNYSVAPLSTATFNSITNGTHDLRLPEGSALLNAGTTDATNAAIGIYGYTRPQGGAYDVGAYESPIVDLTAPTLTSPTGVTSGTTTANGTVSTNEGLGTLYYLASSNASATVAEVKAGNNKSVTAPGTQNVSVTGLTASTLYYLHYVHQDTSGNDSTVSTSTGFTTSAAGDTTAPILEIPTAIVTGSNTATGGVATDEAGGMLYRYASVSPSATAAAIKAANLTSLVSATGAQEVLFTGLTPNTTYYAHYLQRDIAGNDSAVVTSAAFTTQVAPTTTGSFTTAKFGNNTSSGWAAGTTVYWTWFQGGRIGVTANSITHGVGVLSADGTLTVTGIPVGTGFILVAVRGFDFMTDKPFMQPGTVA